MNVKYLKWSNYFAFILMLVINLIANLAPIGIGTTGTISQKYDNLFTPAPITFSIWGVIYILMTLFIVYQNGWIDKGQRSSQVTNRIGLWFTFSCLFNVAWIFAWHYDAILLSFILIVCLLVSLTMIVERLHKDQPTALETLSVRVGFDIYFGWIIAATIANACVLFTKLEWNGFGIPDVVWMLILLFASAVIGIAAVFFRHRIFTALTIIWTYAGILVRHISQDGFKGQYPLVIGATIVAITLVFLAVLMELLPLGFGRTKLRPAKEQTRQ